jgi:DNA invertase Pin-like site-specific DNA recombinase
VRKTEEIISKLYDKHRKYIMKLAVGYARTSSATNVGADKDSLKRQVAAILSYAQANKYEVVQTFYDAAVKGTDNILERKQFAELLQYCSINGITTIIVEDVSRFGRDLLVQLTGANYLKKQGIQLIPANAPDYFLEDSPTASLIRNVLGCLADWQKNDMCHKLSVARARTKSLKGRCEGRLPITMTAPDAVNLAKKLARARKRKPSLYSIARALADAGYLNSKGNVYSTNTVKAMLTQ